jgi:hypothetical protein
LDVIEVSVIVLAFLLEDKEQKTILELGKEKERLLQIKRK